MRNGLGLTAWSGLFLTIVSRLARRVSRVERAPGKAHGVDATGVMRILGVALGIHLDEGETADRRSGRRTGEPALLNGRDDFRLAEISHQRE